MTDMPRGRQRRTYVRFWPTVRSSALPLETRSPTLASDQAFQRRNLHLVLLQRVGGLELVVEGTRFVLRHPDPDEVPRDIVASKQMCSFRLPLTSGAVRGKREIQFPAASIRIGPRLGSASTRTCGVGSVPPPGSGSSPFGDPDRAHAEGHMRVHRILLLVGMAVAAGGCETATNVVKLRGAGGLRER